MQIRGTVVLIHIINLILGISMAFEYTLTVGAVTSMMLALLTGIATNLVNIQTMLRHKK